MFVHFYAYAKCTSAIRSTMPPKQYRNKEKFTREYKVREIQRSITKKARLRRGYLKALKEEGYSVPDAAPDSSRVKQSVRERREDQRREGKRKFDEKKEMKRERRRTQQEQREESRRQQLESIRVSKEKFKLRERRSAKLTQRTRSGQPLMGPKIEDLLDKIKNDDTYTR